MSMVFNLRRHQPWSRAQHALIELSATGVFKEIEFQLVEALLIKTASRMSNLLTSFARLVWRARYSQLMPLAAESFGSSSGVLLYEGYHGRSARYVPKIN